MTDTYVRIRDARDLSYQRPQYAYEGRCPVNSDPDGEFTVICQVTSNVNESTIWCEDECAVLLQPTQLRKCFQAQGTAFATVWQDTDTPNLTTGRVETDARKMQQYLDQRSDEESERLGMTVDFQMVDPTDKDALGLSDEGLDATHDRQISTGQKDSRGRFVWQM